MLVKNVHIHNREGLWQILIEEGKISRIFRKALVKEEMQCRFRGQ